MTDEVEAEVQYLLQKLREYRQKLVISEKSFMRDLETYAKIVQIINNIKQKKSDKNKQVSKALELLGGV